MRKHLLPFLFLSVLGLPARAQTAADSTAIAAAARDYIEGWYTGDAARMERSLHPELAKRIVHTNPEGRSRLDQMSALSLVHGTRSGFGTRTPEAERRGDVRILDVFQATASVRVDARDWVDYLHLARFNGEWKIVNVLWELRK
jgi:hypothetical protein